jgi:predicted lipoprotein with Yx(FWY)xxD motif
VKRLALVLVVVFSLFAASLAAAQDAAATVQLGGNDELGAFLVDANGMTLYTFNNDMPGMSNCVDGCATNWPPLLVAEDVMPTLEFGISGQLGVITRADETRQVTYNGWPLYFWKNDAAAGDATGQGVGDVWWVASMPTVGLGRNADLGQFLVSNNGLTLYIFTNDAAGVSNCVDGCAANWPPLTVESMEALTVQPGLQGEFGVIERADGTMQVTLNEMPLYFWKDDMAAGDATGQGVGDVWWVAKLPLLNVATSDELGDHLVGANGMTLYLFSNDAAGVSNCVDGCAANWPPLFVAADEPMVDLPATVTGEVTTIERPDGALQLAYNGVPLYYWVRDVVPGDTTGQNVGEVWFVVAP